jgi:hypothetical protein
MQAISARLSLAVDLCGVGGVRVLEDMVRIYNKTNGRSKANSEQDDDFEKEGREEGEAGNRHLGQNSKRSSSYVSVFTA